jgi:hypothetical protein
MAFRICHAAAAVSILCSILVCPTEAAGPDPVGSGKLEVGFWGGVSGGPTPTVIGKSEDVRLEPSGAKSGAPDSSESERRTYVYG